MSRNTLPLWESNGLTETAYDLLDEHLQDYQDSEQMEIIFPVKFNNKEWTAVFDKLGNNKWELASLTLNEKYNGSDEGPF